MRWEILHVPGNPPSLLELSTIDVVASTIDPKLANIVVRRLNQICPLENLRHVKRVRRRTIEGKIELSVVLCLSHEHEDHSDGIPDGILQVITDYHLSPFSAKVAKNAASSKEEWENQCKLWPTSYHPPNNNLEGIYGFSEEESQYITNYMKHAIQSTKLTYPSDEVVNAAVIIDPLSKQIIACGTDRTSSRITSRNVSTSKSIHSTEHPATTASPQSDAHGLAINGDDSLPNSSPDEFYTSVSCLNPWAWIEQGPCDQTSSWHPLRHAALVAIENAAARDIQLFPGLESSEDQSAHLSDIPAKRQKVQNSHNNVGLVEEVSMDDLPSESKRPYLCTGFDIYLVWEPCTMCAMALVHQRIRRIFYAFPNPNAGALGSVYRLQGERSLNHHYTVFRIVVPDENP